MIQPDAYTQPYGRQALDLLRIGDEDFPAVLFKRVVHKARAVHRLDHRAHALTMQAPHKAVQPVDAGRHRQLPSRLAALVKQADIQAPSA